MRGADCGPSEMLIALPALWVGLLYDSAAQEEALQLIRPWSVAQILTAYAQAPQYGLKTPIGNRTLQTIAKEVLAISIRGLQRRTENRRHS